MDRTPKREISSVDSLLSMEKLDRSSPDLWPEKSVSNFVNMSNTPINSSPPAWTRGLSQEDLNSMHQLGVLSTNGLIAEIRKLYDQAYQFGLMEAKEMTRGKYLAIFANAKRK
ncbi:protein lin-52 homolog isoform X2 [Hermetia illucens]|uniref:protein lin-52 homolog isoform X2 n=1 Tax=Hermetia illucens TaxID=343691 RepID=UPI0018CC3875|nr:protein lin-52 homolog isoform X2 [Hermetia illucens]